MYPDFEAPELICAPQNVAAIRRDSDGIRMYTGTFKIPTDQYKNTFAGPDTNEPFYSNEMRFNPQIKRVDGLKNISDYLRKNVPQNGSYAVRDHFRYWHEQGENSENGKLVSVDTSNPDVHSIVFDDHVGFDGDSKIIDIRDQRGNIIPWCQAWGVYMVKAQPIYVSTDPEYYIRKVQKCEEARRAIAKLL